MKTILNTRVLIARQNLEAAQRQVDAARGIARIAALKAEDVAQKAYKTARDNWITARAEEMATV